MVKQGGSRELGWQGEGCCQRWGCVLISLACLWVLMLCQGVRTRRDVLLRHPFSEVTNFLSSLSSSHAGGSQMLQEESSVRGLSALLSGTLCCVPKKAVSY